MEKSFAEPKFYGVLNQSAPQRPTFSRQRSNRSTGGADFNRTFSHAARNAFFSNPRGQGIHYPRPINNRGNHYGQTTPYIKATYDLEPPSPYYTWKQQPWKNSYVLANDPEYPTMTKKGEICRYPLFESPYTYKGKSMGFKYGQMEPDPARAVSIGAEQTLVSPQKQKSQRLYGYFKYQKINANQNFEQFVRSGGSKMCC